MSHVDELDANIITLLRRDGRCSNVEIARRLGVAEATVRKRIDRLIRGQVIQIGAWADPLKVGYSEYINFELQVRLRDIEVVAQRLAKLPEIFFLGLCTVRSRIFAAGCFRSNDHFHEFMTKHLGSIRGIQDVSASSITKIVMRAHSFPAFPVDAGNSAGRRTPRDARTRSSPHARGKAGSPPKRTVPRRSTG
jgi:Lrp/AsnC family transcriptional regulator for asnA, asnC and gidA